MSKPRQTDYGKGDHIRGDSERFRANFPLNKDIIETSEGYFYTSKGELKGPFPTYILAKKFKDNSIDT